MSGAAALLAGLVLGFAAGRITRRRSRARRWAAPILAVAAAAEAVRRLDRARAGEQPRRGPSFQHEEDACFDDGAPENMVDEASAESFPASDPPAWTPAKV